jgi:N-acetylneuraminic acid mutarotase
VTKETMTWSQTVGKGSQIPTPRAGHSTTTVVDKLFFFGGGDGIRMFNDLYIFDPQTLTFTRPVLSGNPPVGRCAHTATLWEGKLLIYGGGDGGRRFKDLYMLDVGKIMNVLFFFSFCWNMKNIFLLKISF